MTTRCYSSTRDAKHKHNSTPRVFLIKLQTIFILLTTDGDNINSHFNSPKCIMNLHYPHFIFTRRRRKALIHPEQFRDTGVGRGRGESKSIELCPFPPLHSDNPFLLGPKTYNATRNSHSCPSSVPTTKSGHQRFALMRTHQTGQELIFLALSINAMHFQVQLHAYTHAHTRHL